MDGIERRAQDHRASDAGGRATQDAYMDIGGRVMQEQLPSSCRGCTVCRGRRDAQERRADDHYNIKVLSHRS